MTITESFISCLNAVDPDWIQRRRNVDTYSLVRNVLPAKLNRQGLRQLHVQGECNLTPSAISRARSRIPLTSLSNALQSFVDANKKNTHRRVFAVDSTKVQLPPCFLKHGVSPRNPSAKKPLIMCSTLFDVTMDVPYHVDICSHHNERQSLTEEHSKIMLPGDIVIGDRGYYSAHVCKHFITRDLDVLFRVKERASTPILKFVVSRRNERVIDQDGMKLKCFKYAINSERYTLVTSNLTMTLSQAKALYKMRWRIEEGFRRWKSDFNLTRNVPRGVHEFKVD